MKLYFYPNTSSSNKYVHNLISYLEKRGVKISNKGLDNNFITQVKMTFKSDIDAVHFNWILRKASDYKFKNYVKTYKIIFWIKLLKKLNKKIIWTMHNKIPHETKNLDLVKRLRRFIIINSDLIIIHCNESKNILRRHLNSKEIQEKILYVPHGNYINSYRTDTSDKRKEYNINDDEFVYLFLGHVQPYKNIDLLIKVYNDLDLENTKLLICGKPKNKSLKNDLEKMINDNPNIIFKPVFIKNDELVSYLNTADVFVLPFKKRSMLNSGSLFLGLSYKKPVIIPQIGSVKDIKEKEFVFSYNYNCSSGHYQCLKNKMKEVYNIYNKDKKYFAELGENGYKFVKNNYDWDDISKILVKAYNNL